MREKILYLVKVYLVTVIIFVLAKVVFMGANYSAHPFGLGDVWEVVKHGLSLDLSTSIYILIVPFLVEMIRVWWTPKGLETVMKIYYTIIASAMMLAFTADTSLYPFWGFKLDASCLQYLASPMEAKASVSGWYMAIRIVVIIAGAWVLYKVYQRVAVTQLSTQREARQNKAIQKGTTTVGGTGTDTLVYHWHPRWTGRIDDQCRTGLFLAKPVPEPFGCEPCVQFCRVAGEVWQRECLLQLLYPRGVGPSH